MDVAQVNEEFFFMPVTENAKKYYEKMFPGYESDFLKAKIKEWAKSQF